MGQDNCKPQPGDLIEIDRTGYQHWALYVGDGYVIHVTDEGATSLTLSSSSIRATTAKVKKQLLKDVVGNDNWRVNNKYDHYYTPFPVKKIIQHAEQWVGRVVPYDVLNKNCEHFVTMLRYGEGVSDQGKKALQNLNSISSAVSAGIGAASFIAVAGIPVVGLPLMACVPFVAAGGGGLLASIGFASSNIAHSLTSAKFEKAGKDILEQSCC
uniref:LRAT domain-containing protein n=1 Tax=Taeniopygia guttata TaxID=59729 RepID=A0A674HT37_TAEGU